MMNLYVLACNIIPLLKLYRNTLDRRPRLLSVQIVLIPGLYLGPGFQWPVSNHFEVVDFFCGGCVSTRRLLHEVNVAWNNCFRIIFNACFV